LPKDWAIPVRQGVEIDPRGVHGDLDDDIDDVALRPKLFAAVPRDKLQEQVAGLHDWMSGKRSDVFHGIVRRFSYFRQFSPTMRSALEFFPDELL
jgi:hypothetical protein